jgi:hypothetical protein
MAAESLQMIIHMRAMIDEARRQVADCRQLIVRSRVVIERIKATEAAVSPASSPLSQSVPPSPRP